MSTKKSWLVGITVLIPLLLIVFLGAYFANKQRVIKDADSGEAGFNETASWQTYRNEKYRFEFKYPPNYIIEATDYENDRLVDPGLPQFMLFLRTKTNSDHFMKISINQGNTNSISKSNQCTYADSKFGTPQHKSIYFTCNTGWEGYDIDLKDTLMTLSFSKGFRDEMTQDAETNIYKTFKFSQ